MVCNLGECDVNFSKKPCYCYAQPDDINIRVCPPNKPNCKVVEMIPKSWTNQYCAFETDDGQLMGCGGTIDPKTGTYKIDPATGQPEGGGCCGEGCPGICPDGQCPPGICATAEPRPPHKLGTVNIQPASTPTSPQSQFSFFNAGLILIAILSFISVVSLFVKKTTCKRTKIDLKNLGYKKV